MATLIDMLDGDFPARLTLRLSTSPLVDPPSLAGIVEATFPGYSPAPFTATGRAPPLAGCGYAAGWGMFVFLGPSPSILLTAVYLTAYDRIREHLIHAIPVAGSPNGIMRPGRTTFFVEFMGNIYVPPG